MMNNETWYITIALIILCLIIAGLILNEYHNAISKQTTASKCEQQDVELFLKNINVKEEDLDYETVKLICRNVFSLFTILCWRNNKAQKFVNSRFEVSYRIGRYKFVEVENEVFDSPINISVYEDGKYLFSVFQGSNTYWQWCLHTKLPHLFSEEEIITDSKKLLEIYKVLLLVDYDCQKEIERRSVA